MQVNTEAPANEAKAEVRVGGREFQLDKNKPRVFFTVCLYTV